MYANFSWLSDAWNCFAVCRWNERPSAVECHVHLGGQQKMSQKLVYRCFNQINSLDQDNLIAAVISRRLFFWRRSNQFIVATNFWCGKQEIFIVLLSSQRLTDLWDVIRMLRRSGISNLSFQFLNNLKIFRSFHWGDGITKIRFPHLEYF